MGTWVGPYQILEKIGAGGMGEVFLGHDPRLERRVALKCLTSAASLSGDGHARVLREARAAARLTHPHIAGVYDVLDQDGRTFIVMEYVEGVSLAAHLAGGPLPADEVRRVGRQLASALAAAHAQGVIHRDLKPANIQVMRDGSIKVLDFGVAKLTPAMHTTADTTLGGGAAEHSLGGNPGTPLYMAPEQLRGHSADARSDLYSTGVILFLMATGRRPYLETTAVTLALEMNAAPAPAARSINPLVPAELSEAIGKALARDPGDRFQSARELDSALAAMSGTSSTTRSVNEGVAGGAGDAKPARHGWKLAAAAAVLLTVGAVASALQLTRLSVARPSATLGSATVLAILPVDNATGDPQAGYLAAGMASAVAANFRTLSSVTVLPRDATVPFANRRDDWAGMKTTLGSSSYVLDLSIRRAGPHPEIVAILRMTDASAPIWRETIAGSPVLVENTLLDGVALALSRRAWWRPRALSKDEWARIRTLPTSSDAAAMAYAEASALLDRADLSENPRRAIDRLQAAVDSDRNFALGYAGLGAALLSLYERTKDEALVARATVAVTAALRINADLSAAHYASGYLQYVTGHRQDAVTSLQRAIHLDPDNDAAHRLLGWRLFAQQGRADDAVTELRRAIGIRPDSFENHYRLGTVLYLGGRYGEAATSYRKATEIQPTRAEAYTNLGAAYQMLGDVSQAIGNYEHAIRLGAGDAQAYANLAVTYFMAGRNENALEASLEAVKRDPNRASLQRDLGDYHSSLGRTGDARTAYARAIALARRSLAVNSRDAAAVMVIALCEAHLGNRVEAESRVAEALALAPDDRDILLKGAKAYLILGDRDASLNRLRMAIERGYNPLLVRQDPEFLSLKSLSGFEDAIAGGVRARSRASAPQR